MRFLSRGLLGVFLAAITVALIGYGVLEFSRAFNAEDSGGSRGQRERAFTVSVATLDPGVVQRGGLRRADGSGARALRRLGPCRVLGGRGRRR